MAIWRNDTWVYDDGAQAEKGRGKMQTFLGEIDSFSYSTVMAALDTQQGGIWELSLEGRKKHAKPAHLKPGCDARPVWLGG